MKEYRVQRPSSVWVQTKVEANSFEEALELADEQFSDGDYTELDDTFELDYDGYWIEDEDGEVKEDMR